MTQQPDPNFRNGRKRRVVHPKVDGFGDPLKYPSLAKQAKNLAKTAGQIARNPKVANDDYR